MGSIEGVAMTREKLPRESILTRPTEKSLGQSYEEAEFDAARAHLLRTLEVKRCKDVTRNASWPVSGFGGSAAADHGTLYQGEWRGMVDDPDAFVPPSEEVMKRTRAWYTEKLFVRGKGSK